MERKLSGRKFPFPLFTFLLSLFALSIQSCNGVLDGIYDSAEDVTPKVITSGGTFVVDCPDFDRWYYVDLHSLKDSVDRNPDFKPVFDYRMIPTELTGEWDGHSGKYKYSYEVGMDGRGLEYNTFVSMTPADAQTDPENWDFAFHYINVRTNGAAACETALTSLDDVGSVSDFSGMTFQEDSWDENHVWIDRSEMLLTFVYNQGININKVIGSWLTLDIPPYPPSFNYKPNVYIVRFKDGTYAALRLADYMDSKGNKAHLTIEWKYPLQ